MDVSILRGIKTDKSRARADRARDAYQRGISTIAAARY